MSSRKTKQSQETIANSPSYNIDPDIKAQYKHWGTVVDATAFSLKVVAYLTAPVYARHSALDAVDNFKGNLFMAPFLLPHIFTKNQQALAVQEQTETEDVSAPTAKQDVLAL